MTVESAIAEVREHSLLVLNLFQLKTGQWQANLWDGEKSWDFGRGGSMEDAIRAALRNALSTDGGELYKPEAVKVSNEMLDDLF